MYEHEIKIVKSFVAPTKRERYINLLSNSKGRMKFCLNLAHFNDFDKRFLNKIKDSNQTLSKIERMLVQKGIPKKCYVISENDEIDGLVLTCKQALKQTFGKGMGTILSFIPEKLIYYEGESVGERYIGEK